MLYRLRQLHNQFLGNVANSQSGVSGGRVLGTAHVEPIHPATASATAPACDRRGNRRLAGGNQGVVLSIPIGTFAASTLFHNPLANGH